MKVSVIVAVYKDTEALELILETLSYQRYKNFELVVAEDGASELMRATVEKARSKYDFEIKHTTQDDKGVRKARSQNNAILASSGEYLIFIDGDCLLYSTFIEGHVTLAQKRQVLSGRRVDLPPALTQQIKTKEISAFDIEKHYCSRYLYLAFNKSVKYEQGIYINPKGFIYKNILQNRQRSVAILGCNFSCFKEDIVALNGFDEGYGESAVSDDVDWDWRFRAYGMSIKSCKNVANMMHLWHRAHDRGDASHQMQKMYENQKAGKYICKAGLNTH
jgi:glycosyltransferase involved in cell wall biosynthesis